jgi:uncharacterized protein DUF1592/uncharacterized protein DUF1588/uncharacterized protein DUF1585/uncharacterized protein DUF1587/uncharacterized protein DUF1595/cytochrome c
MSKNSSTRVPVPVRQANPEVCPAGLWFSIFACSFAAAIFLAANSHGAETNSFLRQRKEFISKYCADCHDDASAKSGLDLVHQSSELGNPATFETWVKVHDKVEAGEMPPKKKARPEPADLHAFIAGLTADLCSTEEACLRENGRAMKRRLNRYEYENTLRDLLSLPWIQIKERLPEDGEKYRFNKIGEALDVSYVQLSRYMNSADYALRAAMSEQLEHPTLVTNRYYARDEFSLIGNFHPRENGTLPDRLSFPVLDSHAQPEVRAGRAPVTSPETREREAVGRVSSIFSDAGGYSWSQFRAPVAGKYRLRFKGYTIWVSGGGISRWFYEGFGNQKAPYYYLPLWHRPNLDEIWPGRTNEPIGVYASVAGQNRALGAFDFDPQPTVHEIDVLLAPGEAIRTDGMKLFRTRVNGSDEQYINPRATPEGIPGYAIQWMEVEGPFYDGTQGAGYRRLFGELPLKRLAEGESGVAVEVVLPAPAARGQRGPGGLGGGREAGGVGGGRGLRGGGRGNVMREVKVEVTTANPQQDAERFIRGFVQRAYRHPASDKEIGVFIGLFKEQFAQGRGFAKSMLTAYTAVLSSPGFIYVKETSGRLDDYALASRLSYFLWNSEPDEALRALAAAGQLHQPGVLEAQTDRLMNDGRFRRFIEAFTDYWLDLRKMDDTSPSSTLYNDYELDDSLKAASLEETRLFVEELFRKDLPARDIVSSDFTFLNERLAQHYGVPGVTGANLRRVTLPKDSVRGGLMTQASVLKVTANGTTTSPVLRGHWITERILGVETPPPPKVPSIEPDIRGAVTIRQQLEKHRADPSCASCHNKMDPPGLALESFDVMGGWRDRYRATKEGATPASGIGMDGQKFAFCYALPVDCSGALPDGRTFRDVRALKALLLSDPVSIARNLARQLAVYATGAPVRFSDREQIERIVQRTQAGDYGVRTILRQLVQSDLFQTK